MKAPNISVIIPVYNCEKYIGRCLRSLLTQTLAEDQYEIIVTNDGSTDSTAKILEKFTGNITIETHTTQKGLPTSLNTAIKKANGQYIIRVDSDDYVHTEYLNVLMQFLDFNKDIDAACCDYIEVDDNESSLRRVNSSLEPIGCGIMFRHEQLIDIGLYDESMKFHEDTDMRHRFLEKYSIHRVELPLYRYRKHDSNMTNNLDDMDHYMGELSKKHSMSFSPQAPDWKVPWSGVGARYDEKAIQAVAHAMRTADPLTQGPYQKEFEEKFNKYIGSKAAFAVSSCTSALQLCSDLLEIKNGDEVIVPSHTFCASAIPFAKSGATLKWADIDKDSRIVTAETITPLITSNTKAIVVVHLYGLVCDMDPIMELAKKHNIAVVEDAAQAPGASYKGKKAGSIGTFGCFSFHTHKNISTMGEGGMLTVNDDRYIPLVPGLRHNGVRAFSDQSEYWKPGMSNVDFDIDGFFPNNFCLGEVQCALGTHMLGKLDKLNADRKKRALYVIDELKGYKELSFQKENHPEAENVYHLLVASFDGNQDKLFKILSTEYKIKVINPYFPLHKYPMFRKSGMGDGNCPNTEEYFSKIVAFPFHHWLSDNQVNYMIKSIKAALEYLRGNEHE